MSCLLDTSFLVRLVNVRDALHADAAASLAALFERQESIFITPQTVVEFWSVATRPTGAPNGLGMTVQDASAVTEAFLREFQLAPDSPHVFPKLHALLGEVEVLGKQVHDAHLVAICHVHEIQTIVTFNPRHFERFTALPPGLIVVNLPPLRSGKPEHGRATIGKLAA